MEPEDRHSTALAAIESSVCDDPDVTFVVAFGSRFDGDAGSKSDLDIGVKFTEDLSAHDRFRKRCFLFGDLQREDSPKIDVSDLEALPIDVAHDAVNGEFVCGDESAFRRFAAAVETAFERQRDDLRRHRESVIERIAEEGLRG